MPPQPHFENWLKSRQMQNNQSNKKLDDLKNQQISSNKNEQKREINVLRLKK